MLYKKDYDVSGTDELKKGIISWFFDSELQLFVIKRYDGLQYLEKMIKVFNSLPKCELMELAWKNLINLGNDPYAEVIAKYIRIEGRSRKFDKIKTSIGRRVPDETRVDPRIGKFWMRMVYKRVKCLKQVPLKKMPQDGLKNLKWWYADGETGEALMDDKDDKEVLQVYDYMHLVNLSKHDLLKLHENKILFVDDWRHEGQR